MRNFCLYILLFITLNSCSKENQEKLKLNNCFHAYVEGISGNTDFLRVNGEVKIKLNLYTENIRGFFNIKKSYFADGFIPYKVNDTIIIKVFGDLNDKIM